MQSSPRRRVLFLAVSLTIVMLAAASYMFRGQLARIPVVGWPFATSSPTSPVAGEQTGVAERIDDLQAPPPTSANSPRAAVTVDPRRQQLIGVRMEPVRLETVGPSIRAVGTVTYDETRLADVNLKLEGWIRELYVASTGQRIDEGQPLFTLYSPDLLTTQNEYLLALETRDRMRESTVADVRVYADQLVESARRRLALWDLPPDQLQALEEAREAQTTLVFRSPVGGYVIEKTALVGMHVAPGQRLYQVADLSVVWVEADIYEHELSFVHVGTPATVTLDAYPGERFRGRAVYIYPYMQEQTRTVRVRFELTNDDLRLKPGMFATVELQSQLGQALVVPINALLDSGRQQIVFVSQSNGYFEPRPVTVGRRFDGRVEILSGLSEGEDVAAGAAFFLDSESQLRASLQGFEPSPPGPGAQDAARESLSISFRSTPDPPRTGTNTFTVQVTDPAGVPVTGADVSVVFFMAAMPTMNMPAMQSEAQLSPAGDGEYRGSGQVMMAGRWDVTVVVTRGDERLGSQQFSVVAR